MLPFPSPAAGISESVGDMSDISSVNFLRRPYYQF